MKRRHICSPKTIFYHIDSFSPGVDPMTYIVTCHSYTSKKGRDKIVIYRWSPEYFPVTSFQTTSIHHLLVQVVSYWQNWGKCRMCLKGNVSFAIVGSARREAASCEGSFWEAGHYQRLHSGSSRPLSHCKCQPSFKAKGEQLQISFLG